VGRSRVCGKHCHEAKEPECDCWCSGLFHGAAGGAARDAFARVFGEAPTTIEESSLFWSQAIDAAIQARILSPCAPSVLVVSEGLAMFMPCPHCGRIHRPARKVITP